ALLLRRAQHAVDELRRILATEIESFHQDASGVLQASFANCGSCFLGNAPAVLEQTHDRDSHEVPMHVVIRTSHGAAHANPSRVESSDALVLFGATGDLAYRQIYPALQALVRNRRLDVPVVGVSKTPWTDAQLRERVLASLHEFGEVDPA